MTGESPPGSDPELRALLEKIAATGGDPPEHGLDRVASLRRRRTRHRRGAVAATMALAVAGVGGALWSSTFDSRDHDVSAAGEGGPGDGHPGTPELPDVLSVHCSSAGIEVPVASIRPQSDGLHVLVDTARDRSVEVWVEAAEPDIWESGPIEVGSAGEEVALAVAPGALTVGCRAEGGTEEQRRVELVDVQGVYEPPELSCAEDRRVEPGDAVEIDETTSFVTAVRRGFVDELVDGDQVRALDGYPDQRFSAPAVDPVVRVVRDGGAIAFVRLIPGDVEGPWSAIELVDACEELFTGEPDAGGAGDTTTGEDGAGEDAGRD